MLKVQFEKYLGVDHRVGVGQPATKKADFLTFLVGCIGGWNQHGKTRLEKCREGIFGSQKIQDWAGKVQLEHFLLENLLGDLKTYSSAPYQFGRAGSYVWIAGDDGERVILITFEK